MSTYEGRQIRITEEQHEKLQLIKQKLKKQATEDLGLSRQSWEPSFSDAVEELIDQYPHNSHLEQAWRKEYSDTEDEAHWMDDVEPADLHDDPEELAQEKSLDEAAAHQPTEEEQEEFWS